MFSLPKESVGVGESVEYKVQIHNLLLTVDYLKQLCVLNKPQHSHQVSLPILDSIIHLFRPAAHKQPYFSSHIQKVFICTMMSTVQEEMVIDLILIICLLC